MQLVLRSRTLTSRVRARAGGLITVCGFRLLTLNLAQLLDTAAVLASITQSAREEEALEAHKLIYKVRRCALAETILRED
jgi:hypothetical protein